MNIFYESNLHLLDENYHYKQSHNKGGISRIILILALLLISWIVVRTVKNQKADT